MFNFLGGFFHGIGVAIGTALISVASLLGAHPQLLQPSPVPAIETATTTTQAEASSPAVAPAPTTKTKTTAPVVQTAITQPTSPAPATQAPQPATILQIQSPHTSVTETSVTVTWSTTVPSESQLILDSGKGRGYQSTNGINTQHQVTINNPTESTEYDYEIVATTPDKKTTDTYYGSFTAYEKFIATLGTTVNGCRPIVIRNTAGKVAANNKISVTESIGTFQLGGAITYTTDAHGQVFTDHCSTATKYVVSGENLPATVI